MFDNLLYTNPARFALDEIHSREQQFQSKSAHNGCCGVTVVFNPPEECDLSLISFCVDTTLSCLLCITPLVLYGIFNNIASCGALEQQRWQKVENNTIKDDEFLAVEMLRKHLNIMSAEDAEHSFFKKPNTATNVIGAINVTLLSSGIGKFRPALESIRSRLALAYDIMLMPDGTLANTQPNVPSVAGILR